MGGWVRLHGQDCMGSWSSGGGYVSHLRPHGCCKHVMQHVGYQPHPMCACQASLRESTFQFSWKTLAVLVPLGTQPSSYQCCLCRLTFNTVTLLHVLQPPLTFIPSTVLTLLHAVHPPPTCRVTPAGPAAAATRRGPTLKTTSLCTGTMPPSHTSHTTPPLTLGLPHQQK
jgi:hypothetical protein